MISRQNPRTDPQTDQPTVLLSMRGGLPRRRSHPAKSATTLTLSVYALSLYSALKRTLAHTLIRPLTLLATAICPENDFYYEIFWAGDRLMRRRSTCRLPKYDTCRDASVGKSCHTAAVASRPLRAIQLFVACRHPQFRCKTGIG